MARGRPALSPRKMEILNLYNLGRGRKQIASALHISVETVRTRTDQIKTELDVPLGEDIVFMIRRAYERGILKGESPLLAAADERARRQRPKPGPGLFPRRH